MTISAKPSVTNSLLDTPLFTQFITFVVITKSQGPGTFVARNPNVVVINIAFLVQEYHTYH